MMPSKVLFSRTMKTTWSMSFEGPSVFFCGTGKSYAAPVGHVTALAPDSAPTAFDAAHVAIEPERSKVDGLSMSCALPRIWSPMPPPCPTRNTLVDGPVPCPLPFMMSSDPGLGSAGPATVTEVGHHAVGITPSGVSVGAAPAAPSATPTTATPLRPESAA
jgi:hypothetical protein